MKENILNRYKILTMCVVSATVTACTDFLDVVPNKNIQTPKTISDYQALLDHDAIMNRYTPDIGIISSDDVHLTEADFNSRTEYERSFYAWRHDPTIETVPNAWSRTYSAIFYANTAIDGLKNIPVSDLNRAAWTTCMGTALFHRGKSNLQAVTLWAKAYNGDAAKDEPGVPLRSTPDIYEATVRASLYITYQQILVDLKSAAALLPETVPVKTRPSKAAAYGYLARVGLAMGDYESAAMYADSCLSLQSVVMDYNTIPADANHPFTQFNDEVIIHFACEKTLHNTYPVNPDLYAMYTESDLRKHLFFEPRTENEIRFVGGYDHSRAAYPFTGLTTAEMWLTLAECLAKLGESNRAAEILNQFLKNRYESESLKPFSSEDNEQILDRIREERRKELVFRDVRWFDLKRLNRDGENIVLSRTINGESLSLPADDNRYALPIPAQIIDASGIAQNPK